MFFTRIMEQLIELSPKFLGQNLLTHLHSELVKKVEGTCAGSLGYIVCVIDIKERDEGVINAVTAFASFNVKYEALIFRPFEGEVLDAVVTTVNKMGVFCEAGPLDIFISNYMIPEELEFSNEDADPCYKATDENDDTMIKKDTEMRVRIVGKRIDPEELFCIGTIKDDYLGPYDAV